MSRQPRGTDFGITRRGLVVGAGAVATMASARLAFAGTEADASHYTEAKAYKKRAALVEAANGCISTGRACLSHCMETFLAKDTMMAACALAVEQMLAVCPALATLAASDSKHLPVMAQACIAVCEDCERECRVHQEHQAECRNCADACAALIKEAKKVLA